MTLEPKPYLNSKGSYKIKVPLHATRGVILTARTMPLSKSSTVLVPVALTYLIGQMGIWHKECYEISWNLWHLNSLCNNGVHGIYIGWLSLLFRKNWRPTIQVRDNFLMSSHLMYLVSTCFYEHGFILYVATKMCYLILVMKIYFSQSFIILDLGFKLFWVYSTVYPLSNFILLYTLIFISQYHWLKETSLYFHWNNFPSLSQIIWPLKNIVTYFKCPIPLNKPSVHPCVSFIISSLL